MDNQLPGCMGNQLPGCMGNSVYPDMCILENCSTVCFSDFPAEWNFRRAASMLRSVWRSNTS